MFFCHYFYIFFYYKELLTHRHHYSCFNYKNNSVLTLPRKIKMQHLYQLSL